MIRDYLATYDFNLPLDDADLAAACGLGGFARGVRA